MFADDTIIYSTGTTLQEVTGALQDSLDDVSYWYTRNKLTVNAGKSKSMLITQNKINKELFKLFMDGEEIQQVNDTKYLGIYLDENINWFAHLQKLHVKVMSKLAVLRRLSKFLPKNILELIYKTTILPCIDYADTVWGTCSVKGLKMAQRLQNAAARVITGNYDYGG